MAPKLGIVPVSALLLLASGCGQDRAVSFRDDVMPILQAHCSECHTQGGEGVEASGFSVASYETVMEGTQYGSVIKPGSSFDSTLVVLIEGRADHSINMPRDRPQLSDKQIATIRRWIDQGAKNN